MFERRASVPSHQNHTSVQRPAHQRLARVNVAFDDEVGIWQNGFQVRAKCFQGSANSAKQIKVRTSSLPSKCSKVSDALEDEPRHEARQEQRSYQAGHVTPSTDCFDVVLQFNQKDDAHEAR